LTINKEKGEVMIGFKSKEARAEALEKIPIDYFSKEKFLERWYQ
jgi:hypothetical protein